MGLDKFRTPDTFLENSYVVILEILKEVHNLFLNSTNNRIDSQVADGNA